VVNLKNETFFNSFYDFLLLMVLDSDIVKELVEDIAGKDVFELVEMIKGKKDVSEFKLAEKLGITVNQARNMLYRLYAHNIVSFIRKKDKQKGWYIYYWTLDQKKSHDLYLKIKKEKLETLKERLVSERERTHFACPNECMRMNFENAMESDFKCPDCGVVLEQENNARRISAIEREIKYVVEQLDKPYFEDKKRKPRKKAKRKPTKKKLPKKKTTSKRKSPKKKTTSKRKSPKKKTTSKRKITARKTSKKK
jgi:transcription initiation factor TFIIE subunit alpha